MASYRDCIGCGRGRAGLLFLSVQAAFHLLHFPPDLSTLLNSADPLFSSSFLSFSFFSLSPSSPFSCPSYPSPLPSPPLVFLCPPLISISLPARYFLLFLPGLLRHFLLVSPCPSFVPSVVLLPFLFFVFINSRQTRRIFSTLMLPCDVTFASSVFSVDSANPDEGRKLLPLLPCRRRTMVITPL